MKKIKEIQNREKLSEGRNFGIGFSILKKIGLNKFETYMPFTACRDYLNDFIYVESQKEEIEKIYGYKHKLLNCFDNKRIFYLGVNALHYNKTSDKWKGYNECINIFKNNYKQLEKNINIIEELLELKIKSKIYLDEDTLIVKAPIFWTKSAPLISVFTLFIRCTFNLKENFNIKEPKFNTFIQADSYMSDSINQFILLVKKKVNFCDYKIIYKPKSDKIHNTGISNFINNYNK